MKESKVSGRIRKLYPQHRCESDSKNKYKNSATLTLFKHRTLTFWTQGHVSTSRGMFFLQVLADDMPSLHVLVDDKIMFSLQVYMQVLLNDMFSLQVFSNYMFPRKSLQTIYFPCKYLQRICSYQL